jgi:hypothetical protein
LLLSTPQYVEQLFVLDSCSNKLPFFDCLKSCETNDSAFIALNKKAQESQGSVGAQGLHRTWYNNAESSVDSPNEHLINVRRCKMKCPLDRRIRVHGRLHSCSADMLAKVPQSAAAAVAGGNLAFAPQTVKATRLNA